MHKLIIVYHRLKNSADSLEKICLYFRNNWSESSNPYSHLIMQYNYYDYVKLVVPSVLFP